MKSATQRPLRFATSVPPEAVAIARPAAGTDGAGDDLVDLPTRPISLTLTRGSRPRRLATPIEDLTVEPDEPESFDDLTIPEQLVTLDFGFERGPLDECERALRTGRRRAAQASDGAETVIASPRRSLRARLGDWLGIVTARRRP